MFELTGALIGITVATSIAALQATTKGFTITKIFKIEDDTATISISHNTLTGQKQIFLNDVIVHSVSRNLVESSSRFTISSIKGEYELFITPNHCLTTTEDFSGFNYKLSNLGVALDVL